MTDTDHDNTISKIAKDQMQIETLQTRKHDGLDFHTVAVWEAKSALQAAYDAGRADANASLADAMRENLSPEAVAAIASWLQPAHTNDDDVNRELRWFSEQLALVLGGWDHQKRLAEQLGL